MPTDSRTTSGPAPAARRSSSESTALIDAGLEIHAEREVVATPVENRPGSAAAVLRGVADAGVNIDLLYVTADSRLVLGGNDLPAIRKALA